MSRRNRKLALDQIEELSKPITAFITATIATVQELDGIVQQPNPKESFLEQMEYHVDEIETQQSLSRSEKDFLDTLYLTFLDGVRDLE